MSSPSCKLPLLVRVEPGRQTVSLKNRPLVSGDNDVEEVYRRRISIKIYNVSQSFRGVLYQSEFLGCSDTHDTHRGCATGLSSEILPDK